MIGKGTISGRFWYQAEWVPFAMSARHPVGNVINWVRLEKQSQRNRVINSRNAIGGNQFFTIYQ